jgi:hypothetical protein
MAPPGPSGLRFGGLVATLAALGCASGPGSSRASDTTAATRKDAPTPNQAAPHRCPQELDNSPEWYDIAQALEAFDRGTSKREVMNELLSTALRQVDRLRVCEALSSDEVALFTEELLRLRGVYEPPQPLEPGMTCYSPPELKWSVN